MKVGKTLRRIVCLPGLLALSLLSAFALADSGAPQEPGQRVGFGSPMVDANPEKTGVLITDEHGDRLAAAARLSKKIASSSHGGPRRIPRSIRATWRTGQFAVTSEGTWSGGTVMGDHTATVAERIPREVFDYMRQHGGARRLKLRIVDGAVLVGWDVEKYVPVKGRKPGEGDSGFHYYIAGGDFREDKVVNGKIVEPGWERIPARRTGYAPRKESAPISSL